MWLEFLTSSFIDFITLEEFSISKKWAKCSTPNFFVKIKIDSIL